MKTAREILSTNITTVSKYDDDGQILISYDDAINAINEALEQVKNCHIANVVGSCSNCDNGEIEISKICSSCGKEY